jgi:general secretion pathway protein H
LLVVLALVALLAAFVLPSFRPGADAAVRTAIRDVAASLRLARNQALAGNRPVRFTLDADQRTYWLDGARRGSLPEGVEIRMVAAETERLSGSRAAIRFFPDGSATGGSVTLVRNGRSREVEVDWLTGRVGLRD